MEFSFIFVTGKTRQNRSHHKSGDEKHELTADELETITASHSLEEILETVRYLLGITLRG